MSTATAEQAQTFPFQAEVNQVLSLVINSLYSNKEIFLRELVSNASDALDKLKFQALTEHDLLGEDKELKIQLIPNEGAKTLTIRDNGVGMTRDELIKYLGTVAHSGTLQFFKSVKEQKKDGDLSLIGQFGVGFYSAFLVADKVDVVSRPAREEQAYKWSSDAQGSFTVEPVEERRRGTSITLHFKSEHEDFLREWRLRELIRKFSDYVSFPIELEVTRTVSAEDEDEDSGLVDDKGEPVKSEKPKEKKTETKFEVVNSASALWKRAKTDLKDEDYNEFYKHLSHDWKTPLTRSHFTIEGRTLFTGLIFVPQHAPFDLFTAPDRRGVRLFVRRVFIMDDCKDLVPEYLRFLKGVVDSDDLPLNVSREILQDDRLVQFIKGQLVKKALEMLDELAEKDAKAYESFWKAFGVVLKEGIHTDHKNKERIAKLLRFESTKAEGLTSLDAYIERMAKDQPGIYYIAGESRKALENSPHLEALKKKGYEVIFMTDTIDEWVSMGLDEYKGKNLISATKGDLKLEVEETKKAAEEKAKEFKDFTEAVKEILGDRVEKVELSRRLADSPCCLVVPEHGMHAHMERILRQNRRDVPDSKRIFEINAEHSLIAELRRLHEQKSDSLRDWIELLYAQALITEGSPLADPADFAQRMTKVMSQAMAKN